MSDFPFSGGERVGPIQVIHPAAPSQPVGNALFYERTLPAAKAVWPTANLALFIPFIIEKPLTIFQLGMMNGVKSGNVDIGIYKFIGTGGTIPTLVVSNGVTAMAEENSIQLFNIENTELTPGNYLFAFVCSTGVTATFQRANPAAATLQALGCAQAEAAEATLPESVLLSKMASAYVPFGCVIGVESV